MTRFKAQVLGGLTALEGVAPFERRLGALENEALEVAATAAAAVGEVGGRSRPVRRGRGGKGSKGAGRGAKGSDIVHRGSTRSKEQTLAVRAQRRRHVLNLELEARNQQPPLTNLQPPSGSLGISSRG